MNNHIYQSSDNCRISAFSAICFIAVAENKANPVALWEGKGLETIVRIFCCHAEPVEE